jgi:hypothetical protein
MRPKGDPRSPAARSVTLRSAAPEDTNATEASPWRRTVTSETGGAEAAPLLPLLAARTHGLRMMTNGFHRGPWALRVTLVGVGVTEEHPWLPGRAVVTRHRSSGVNNPGAWKHAPRSRPRGPLLRLH